MAHNDIILDDLVELINHHGRIDALGAAIGTLMNAAMRIERQMSSTPNRTNAYGSKTQPNGRSCSRRAYMIAPRSGLGLFHSILIR